MSLLFMFFGFLLLGVRTPLLSSLDAKLMPEHLLHLCLDYERKFLSFHSSPTRYNFYKVLPSLLFWTPFTFCFPPFPFYGWFLLDIGLKILITFFLLGQGFKCFRDGKDGGRPCSSSEEDFLHA